MPYFHLKLSGECAYPNHVRGMMVHVRCQPATFSWNCREFVTERMPPSLASVSSSRFHPLRANASIAEMYSACGYLNLYERQPFDEDAEVDSLSLVNGSNSGDKDNKEEERKRKIGLANKGRVPWNKGRKHTEETRVRIKQRTIEALRDPKVRKKMAEHPQAHSDETKRKIRSSLKQLWNERLKQKRLREKFMFSWSESIAEAAKKGGSDQQELDWNSYDRIKQEISLKQHQWAAEKEKAKELAKLRAEKAALVKAEKMEKLAQRRKEREEKAKAKREMMQKPGRSGHDKDNLAVASEVRLKRRLMKLHRKKPKPSRVAIGREGISSIICSWEKLDIELIKKEKMRKEISLADQIQAAKNRRTSEQVPISS